MLSDMLFDAIQDMVFYQEEYPQLYDAYREEIETLKSLMKQLQIQLDCPPGMFYLPRS